MFNLKFDTRVINFRCIVYLMTPRCRFYKAEWQVINIGKNVVYGVVFQSEALSRNLPGRTEESHETLVSVACVLVQVRTACYRILVTSDNTWSKFPGPSVSMEHEVPLRGMKTFSNASYLMSVETSSHPGTY